MLGIDRVAFELFGFPVYWYGLMIAAGMLLGVMLASAREKLYGQEKDTVFNFILWAIPVALVCARIYYVVFTWSEYAPNPMEIFNVRNGGMAIYGGVIGGVITGLIYTRVKKISFGTLADLCAPALALGQAMGRWGNFFNQEAYGAAVESTALQFFPAAVYIEALGQWRYATFFYESSWCFLIVAALLIAERRHLFHRPGDLFLWYGLTYAAERVVVEGMRSDSLYLGDIRISQLLSAALLIACGVVFLIRVLKKTRRVPVSGVLFILFALALPLSFMFLPVPGQAAHALLLIVLGILLYRNTNVEGSDLRA